MKFLRFYSMINSNTRARKTISCCQISNSPLSPKIPHYISKSNSKMFITRLLLKKAKSK